MTKKEREYKVQFVVDYTNVKEWEEITSRMAIAKIEKGFGVSKNQFNALLATIVEDTINMLFDGCNMVIRMPNGTFLKGNAVEYAGEPKAVTNKGEKASGFLKRVWNKIKRLFSRK